MILDLPDPCLVSINSQSRDIKRLVLATRCIHSHTVKGSYKGITCEFSGFLQRMAPLL